MNERKFEREDDGCRLALVRSRESLLVCGSRVFILLISSNGPKACDGEGGRLPSARVYKVSMRRGMKRKQNDSLSFQPGVMNSS